MGPVMTEHRCASVGEYDRGLKPPRHINSAFCQKRNNRSCPWTIFIHLNHQVVHSKFHMMRKANTWLEFWTLANHPQNHSECSIWSVGKKPVQEYLKLPQSDWCSVTYISHSLIPSPSHNIAHNRWQLIIFFIFLIFLICYIKNSKQSSEISLFTLKLWLSDNWCQKFLHKLFPTKKLVHIPKVRKNFMSQKMPTPPFAFPPSLSSVLTRPFDLLYGSDVPWKVLFLSYHSQSCASSFWSHCSKTER